MHKKIVIVGAGGHAKVIRDIVKSNGDIVIGFLDDIASNDPLGAPILGEVADMVQFCSDVEFVIGIGSNRLRQAIADQFCVPWYTAVHSSAVISQDVVLGEGTVVMANAVINASSRVGRHSIINTGAIVEHDNHLGDYVHLSPRVALGGTVQIGDFTHVGIGAVIINNVTISANCVIGAGAAVINDLSEAGVYVGVPARLLHR